MRRSIVLSVVVFSLLSALPASAQGAHSAENATVVNPDDGTKIAITVFKPANASPTAQVPVILHSHGWAGSRNTTISGTTQAFLDAGFGVVSIDQRGHGQSSGQANVQDPTKETEDIKAVIDHIAGLPWVLHNTDSAGAPIPDDPVLGAIGGSYGGGYQTMTALDEIADEGRTRFDALAPEITWYDLNESLAPQGVVRTAWASLLYAAGARMLPQYVHEGFAWGVSTGQWPDGTLYGQTVPGAPNLDAEFHKHGPVFFAERGIKIDIPVLLRQGTSDNLFNLNEGIHIFEKALTREAQEDSLFIAYNGGHALPNALPAGTAAGGDACSTDFTQLRIAFFRAAFAGQDTASLLPARYNMTTVDGQGCLRLGDLDGRERFDVALLGGEVVTTAGAGAPLHVPVTDGPITVAGIPTLRGEVTNVGLDSRAFFALSMGTSPADAKVIQNNMMPLRRVLPSDGARFEIELPGVVAEIPQGQRLFLTVSPVSDMSFGHSSRTPAPMILSDLVLEVPVPGSGGDGDEAKRCGPPEGKGGDKQQGSDNCGGKNRP